MNKIVDLLKKETVSLKEQYINKTIDWAKKDFDRYMIMSSWNEEKWAKYLDVPTRIANEGSSMEFVTFHNGFYNTKKSREYKRMKDTIYNMKRLGLSEYILKAKKQAERHYEDSILKLSERILKKGLDEDNIKLSTSHIGVNIETTITDGNKTVRAFTIIAEGEIQRPHYRYLIK